MFYCRVFCILISSLVVVVVVKPAKRFGLFGNLEAQKDRSLVLHFHHQRSEELLHHKQHRQHNERRLIAFDSMCAPNKLNFILFALIVCMYWMCWMCCVLRTNPNRNDSTLKVNWVHRNCDVRPDIRPSDQQSSQCQSDYRWQCSAGAPLGVVTRKMWIMSALTHTQTLRQKDRQRPGGPDDRSSREQPLEDNEPHFGHNRSAFWIWFRNSNIGLQTMSGFIRFWSSTFKQMRFEIDWNEGNDKRINTNWMGISEQNRGHKLFREPELHWNNGRVLHTNKCDVYSDKSFIQESNAERHWEALRQWKRSEDLHNVSDVLMRCPTPESGDRQHWQPRHWWTERWTERWLTL